MLSGGYVKILDVFKNRAFKISIFCLFFPFLHGASVVDTSLSLSAEECDFIRKRDSFTQDKILNLVSDLFPGGFDKNINKLPRIAFCFSGGGNRALITSLGFMQGMQDCGLVDCASHCSFLSGSAWFYISFLLKNMGLDQYRKFIQSRLAQPFNRSFYSLWCELSRITKMRGYSSISDGYGKTIFDYLLGDSIPEDTSFSIIRNALLSGEYNMPFPLFTAIVKTGFPYKWLEINPFLTGSDELGGYVKTENWGSCFEKGICTKELPEISLASFMGICGSAYCLNQSDFERFGGRESLKSQSLYYYLEQTLGRVISTDSLLFSAMHQIESRSMFENFLYDTGLTGSGSKRVVVADAALDFNLPTPPLLKQERGIDIIFICDASAYSDQSNELEQFKLLASHAQRNGLAIPDLENPIKITDNVLIFEDKDPQVPTIVYFKLDSQFGSLKFDYTNDEFNIVCDSARNIVSRSQCAINLAIRKKTVLVNKNASHSGWFKKLLSHLSI